MNIRIVLYDVWIQIPKNNIFIPTITIFLKAKKQQQQQKKKQLKLIIPFNFDLNFSCDIVVLSVDKLKDLMLSTLKVSK